jgi:hypothetical protein
VRISLSSKDGATIITTPSVSSAKGDGKKKIRKKDKLLKGAKPKVKGVKKLKGEGFKPKLKLTVGDSQAVPPVSVPLPASVAGDQGGEASLNQPKLLKKIKLKDKIRDKQLLKEKRLKAKEEKKKAKLALAAGGVGMPPKSVGGSNPPIDPAVQVVVVRPPASYKPSGSIAPETGLRQAFAPTDIFDSTSQASAQHLMNIDDSINAVVRDSASSADDKPWQQTPSALAVPLTPSPRKRGRPRKIKPAKTSEFVADDILKREQEDLSPKIGGLPPFSQVPAANLPHVEGVKRPAESGDGVTPPPSKKIKKEKEGKKKKDKDGLEKKKKKKLKKLAGLLPGDVPMKVEEESKIKQEPPNVFDFDPSDSPPALIIHGSESSTQPPPTPCLPPTPQPPPPATPTHLSPVVTPTATRPPSIPTPTRVPSTPASARGSMSPLEFKPLVVKSPTPEAIIAASSASTSSATSSDQPPIMPLKIGIPKEEDRVKEKERDREHREHKKEKKEKKKKKDKDRDREHHKDRHEKHKHKKEKKDRDRERSKEKSEETVSFFMFIFYFHFLFYYYHF